MTVSLFINMLYHCECYLKKKSHFYCSDNTGYISQLNWVFIGTLVEKEEWILTNEVFLQHLI